MIHIIVVLFLWLLIFFKFYDRSNRIHSIPIHQYLFGFQSSCIVWLFCLLRWPLHTSIHLRSQMGLDLGLKPSEKIKLLGVAVLLEIIKSPRKDSKNDHFYLQTHFILRQYFQFQSEPEVIYISIWTKLWLLFYWKSSNLPLSEMWKLFYKCVVEWVRFWFYIYFS